MHHSDELIYEPDPTDRDHWEHTMFRMQYPPAKLSCWQDYFVRIKQGGDCFPGFLHYYEPTLNSIAKSFTRRYGLNDHFADVKMTYAETLLKELEFYDPASGVDFLVAVQRKLDAALHGYAMTNLKGFSETSATHYYQLRKAAFISKSNPEGTILPQICEELNVQSKTAIRLLEEVHTLDTFQWFTGIITDDGQEDIPVGVDILGYCQTTQPEQIILHQETILALRQAFWKLTYKEQDIISRHLGFYKVCFRPLPPNTFEDLADLYQYTTADGVMRFYYRTLDKLRLLLDREGMFKAVRLKRKKKTAKKFIYSYIPSNEGNPGTIEFIITNGVVQQDCNITKAENDYRDMRIGYASARLLLKLAQQDVLPADRIFPLQNIHIPKEKSSH